MNQTDAGMIRNAGWKQADLGQGTSLAYKITGSGDKRCVFIHSLAMDGAFWDGVASFLEADTEVLVYDCRGHGKSSKPRGSYTVELFASDLDKLLDVVGWDSATIVGSSMGGCVALAFAAAFPQRVEALGLIDTTSWYGVDAPAQWAARATKAKEEGISALIDFQKSRWFSDSFLETNPQIVQNAVDCFLRNDVDAYAETCRMLGAADLRSALPGFDFPCRVIVGQEDYATPISMATAMAETIPGAQMCIIENARHFTPLEVPDVIASETRKLMGQTQQKR